MRKKTPLKESKIDKPKRNVSCANNMSSILMQLLKRKKSELPTILTRNQADELRLNSLTPKFNEP